tara:strand:+ start:2653 stop:2958 length:306 start_codon:yes stop_codon:yes gene_type:complete
MGTIVTYKLPHDVDEEGNPIDDIYTGLFLEKLEDDNDYTQDETGLRRIDDDGVIILKMHSINTTNVYYNVDEETLPEDLIFHKYFFNGTDWTLNSNYEEPE